MRIQVPRAALRRALEFAMLAASERRYDDDPATLLLAKEGVLTVLSRNSEMIAVYRSGAIVKAEGCVLLHAESLKGLAASLKGGPRDGDVLIAAEGAGPAPQQALRVVSGGVSASFACRILEDGMIPPIPSPGEGMVELRQADLMDAVKHVAFAASRQDLGEERIYNGIALRSENFLFGPGDGFITMIASDRYRMAVKAVPARKLRDGFSVVVPARPLRRLCEALKPPKAEDATVVVSMARHPDMTVRDEALVCFRLQNLDAEVYFLPIRGDLIDPSRYLSDEFRSRAVVPRDELLKALRAMRGSRRERSPSPDAWVRIGVDPASQSLSAHIQTDYGQEIAAIVRCRAEGEPVQVFASRRFLTEALEVLDCEEVIIQIRSPKSPVTLSPNGDRSFVYVFMPVIL